MAMRELNFPMKVVQRDGWSESETVFLINCYNQYRDEIGKNKIFKSKKEFFSNVAKLMADGINSQKTADQVSSRFYTLTRKPKNYNRPSSDLGSISNINATTAVDASLLKLNEIASVDLNSPLIVNLDGTEYFDLNSNDTNISMSVSMDEKSHEKQLTPIARNNESVFSIVNESSRSSQGTDKITSIGMLLAFNSESHRNKYSNTSANCSPVTTVPDENTLGGYYDNTSRTSSDDRSSLARIANASSSSNCTVTSGAFQTTSSDLVFSTPRITSVVGHLAIGQESLSDTQSHSTNCDDRSSLARIAYTSSSNCTVTSGALSTIQTSDIRSQPLSDIRSQPLSDIRSRPTSEQFSSSIQSTSTVIGRPVVAVQSLPASSSTRVIDLSARPTIRLPSTNSTSSSRNSSKINECLSDGWAKPETEWLLLKYYENLDEVGPLKKYRTKNDMWQSLAECMSEYFPSYRTGDDLSKRVQYLINQKKKAVGKNRTSGASRVNVEYEDLINKIASIDDSIEPEVLRDSNSVYYKKTSKNDGQRTTKKPRWDKPNKKAILDTLSDTMLSIEKRRDKRDKLKEERRKQNHLELLELLQSGKNREN